ncbi:MAG: hypothetical protein KC646_13995 [Candidatus Cloacimonetes bacterium]|nr:hypothetical protein [Candidatus Cloacimonadota bacterium]
MKFLRLLLLILCLTPFSEAIIFENTQFNDVDFQKANANVSLELKTVVETIKLITEETMKVYGEVTHPYSNVENEVIINVLLYDIIDRDSNVSNRMPGYFSQFDQLKENGTGVDKIINGVSNFGNIIYLDLDPYDPTLKLATSSSDVTTKSLFANRNSFYGAYAGSLAKLIHFQRMNAGIKDYQIANNLINIDYNWLDSILANFNSFRAMKNLNVDQYGVEPGVKLQVTTATLIGGLLTYQTSNGDSLYDTTGAVNNPNDYSSIDKNIAPRSLIHYLKNKPKDLPFPHLFYKDQVLLKYQQSEILTERNYGDLSDNLGTFLMIYMWEQLQSLGVDDGDTTRRMGDRFIQVLANLKNTFEIAPGVQSSFYQTSTVIPDPIQIASRKACTQAGAPVDKICQINKALFDLLMSDADVADRPDSFASFIGVNPEKSKKNRNFQDYFDDMAVAMYMDRPATDRTAPLSRYELRNFDMAKLDNIYAGLSKENVFSFNIGQRPGVDHRCEINSANTVNCVPTELVKVISSISSKSTSASYTASEELYSALFSQDFTPNKANVNQYSIDYYKLLNSASTADISFGIDDVTQLNDVSSKRSFVRTSIKTKFIDQNSKMNYGITTYIVGKSTSATDQTSSRVLYASGIQKSQIGIQIPKASFSNSSLSRVSSKSRIERISKNRARGSASISKRLEGVHASILKNYNLSRSVGAISGVTQWDRYKTVNEVRTNPSVYDVDTAFRNYTTTFKTIDFSKTDETKVIYNKNTALLKEKITGTFRNLRYKILLWVDQQNLSKGDTEVPQPEDTSGSTIEEDPNPTQQVTKAVDIGALDFSSGNQTGESVNISSLSDLDNPYILKITNNTDEAISIKFSLNNSTKASEKFLLTNPSASKSRVAANWKTLILTKKSIQYSTFAQDSMDASYTIAPRSVRSFGIANKGNSNESLLYVLQKVQSSSSQVGDPTVAAVENSGGGGGGGCFIATAAYGSLYHPIVKDLVKFRDQILLKSNTGTQFVNLYYTYSPKIANFIAESQVLRWLTAMALLPLWLFSIITVYSFSLSLALIFALAATGLVWLFRPRLR